MKVNHTRTNRWNAEYDQQLLDLIEKGLRPAAIAKIMGRQVASINARISRVASFQQLRGSVRSRAAVLGRATGHSARDVLIHFMQYDNNAAVTASYLRNDDSSADSIQGSL